MAVPSKIPTLPYICARCLRSASRPATSTKYKSPKLPQNPRTYSTATTPPPAPPSSAHVKLTNRNLILLHGRDTTHFLHGITTNSVRHGQTHGFYSTFLNAQGRILQDVFIYPASHSHQYLAHLTTNPTSSASSEDPAYFIEVDSTQTRDLLKHLKRYKLRAKFDMRIVDPEEYGVYSYWDSEERWTPHPQSKSQLHTSGSPDPDNNAGMISAVDTRAPGLGHRVILRESSNPSSTSNTSNTSTFPTEMSRHSPHPSPSDLPPAPLSAYHIRRTLRGIPEGQSTGEIPSGTSLPHELNLDLTSGIDFKKGCYVGQELTIRTQHTGVVRKRCLPVCLYGAGEEVPERLEYDPSAEAAGNVEGGVNVLPLDTNGGSKARPRPAGKMLSTVGNIGLGLCRVEKMTDVVLTAEGSRWGQGDEFYIPEGVGEGDAKGDGGVRVKAFVPDWIRNQIKVREPQRRVE